MKPLFILAPLLTVALGLVACDPDPKKQEDCERFAKHLAEVIQTEQGEEVPQAQVDGMVEATVAGCLEHVPSDKQFECAMAADSTAAIKKCDEAAGEAEEASQ